MECCMILGNSTSPSGLSFFICKRGLDKQFPATSRDPHYDLHHHFASLHPTPTGLDWEGREVTVDQALLHLPSGLSRVFFFFFNQFWILNFLERRAALFPKRSQT